MSNVRPLRAVRTDPCPPLTSFQKQASAAAYTEADSLRWAFAEFDQACKQAIELYQAKPPRPGRADWLICKASLKVAHAVKEAQSVEVLGELRFFEPFHTEQENHA